MDGAALYHKITESSPDFYSGKASSQKLAAETIGEDGSNVSKKYLSGGITQCFTADGKALANETAVLTDTEISGFLTKS
jgi:hypothetical protein